MAGLPTLGAVTLASGLLAPEPPEQAARPRPICLTETSGVSTKEPNTTTMIAAAAEITREPAHPYTRGLLNSFPSLHGARRELAGIPGTPPDLRHPPPGCPFLPRCGYGTDACRTVDMSLERVASSADLAHLTACPFVLPETPAPEPARPARGPAQVAALLNKTVEAARNGQFELYKTSTNFDGTGHNPQWLG